MKLLVSILSLGIFVVSISAAQTPHAPHVHMAGDSTMADKPTDPPNPEFGWGQLLPKFFKDPAMIVNHAATAGVRGASSRKGDGRSWSMRYSLAIG